MTALRFTVEHEGDQVEVVPAALFDAVVRQARLDIDVLTAAVELGSAFINGSEEQR